MIEFILGLSLGFCFGVIFALIWTWWWLLHDLPPNHFDGTA